MGTGTDTERVVCDLCDTEVDRGSAVHDGIGWLCHKDCDGDDNDWNAAGTLHDVLDALSLKDRGRAINATRHLLKLLDAPGARKLPEVEWLERSSGRAGWHVHA